MGKIQLREFYRFLQRLEANHKLSGKFEIKLVEGRLRLKVEATTTLGPPSTNHLAWEYSSVAAGSGYAEIRFDYLYDQIVSAFGGNA